MTRRNQVSATEIIRGAVPFWNLGRLVKERYLARFSTGRRDVTSSPRGENLTTGQHRSLVVEVDFPSTISTNVVNTFSNGKD